MTSPFGSSHMVARADHYEVEAVLQDADVQHRWVDFVRRTAWLGSTVAVLVLLIGLAMAAGWIQLSWLVIMMFVIVALASLFAWLVIAVISATGSDERQELAADLERAHRPLLDRLNALVYLEKRRDEDATDYARCIEEQTADVLRQEPPPTLYGWSEAWRPLAVFSVLLIATIAFYMLAHPWQRMREAIARAEAAREEQEAERLEIPPREEELPADTLGSEPSKPWGEVRISDPGQDLATTPLDVVPMHIEAAASQPLERVRWYVSRNGQDPDVHELPTPEDPQYASYDAELSLPDLQAEPWDAITYWAEAQAQDGQRYVSEQYQLDVLPLREELENLPGGLDGPAGQWLERTSDMIARQQEVIRQTAAMAENKDPQGTELPFGTGDSNDVAEDWRQRLAEEETALRDAARHLAAETNSFAPVSQSPSAASQSKPISAAEQLEKAADHLNAARQTIERPSVHPEEMLAAERVALQSLVQARKSLPRELVESPELAEQFSATSPPSATDPQQLSRQFDQQLRQLHDRRAERQRWQAAQEFVERLLERQRNVERQVSPTQTSRYPKLSQDQAKLEQELTQYAESNSEGMRPCAKQLTDAQKAMKEASQSLRGSASKATAPQKVKEAGDRLQELAQSLETQQQRSRLSDAYAMKRLMDQQMQRLGQCRKSGASSGACRQMASGSQALANQLRQMAQEPGAAEQLGSELSQSLGNSQMQKINQAAGQLGSAQTQQRRQSAAGQLQQQLDPVANALAKSCPQSLGNSSQQRGNAQQSGLSQSSSGSGQPRGSQRRGPSLRPSGQEALQRALRTLRSIASRQTQGRRLSQREGQQAMSEFSSQLEAGLNGMYGHNENTQRVLDQAQRMASEQQWPVNMEDVYTLVAELDRLQRDEQDMGSSTEEPSPLQDVTPDRIPPEYRRSIQRYFEKLSEGQ